MTPPRDDIAGLSERLRDRDAIVLSGLFYCGPLMREAATQIDSLLKEREALQARVKELEDGRNFWKSERDRIKAFLSEGDWQTIESEQAWRKRALRAEQERDEAYERAAKVADQWLESSWVDEVFAARSIADAIRRLAGPEKEKKE